MAKPLTYRDLQRWLHSLSAAQLDAPILTTPVADDFGSTEFLPVVELIEVAREHAEVSGGYEGPVLLIREQVEERREARERDEWTEPHEW